MANLRDLTINQPTSMDQITFDPRTRQYHDIANRYRMVRQSVVESLQRTNRIERNDSERYVAHTVFDAFRRDVYRHISDTANLTKKAVESLRTSLQNQIDDNRRLQQDINDTRENRQEQIQDRLSEESKRYESSPRRERSNRSFLSSFLGISGLGFGAFAALSYFMTPEQITRFGERIDETLSFIPDIQSTINAVNEINETMRRMLAFFGITAPQEGQTSQNTPAGDGSEHTPEPNRPNTPSRPTADQRRSMALGLPPNATEEQRTEVSMALGAETGGPAGRHETNRQRVERMYNERRQTEQAAAEQYRIERAPERPEDIISQNLLNEQGQPIGQEISNIRNNRDLTEARQGQQIVNVIKDALDRAADRSQLANTIETQIGTHSELHGAGDAARRMIEHSDTGRAAELIYKTFYAREVSGRGRGGSNNPSQRRIELQRRIRTVNTELNSRTETIIPENRSTAAVAITAAAAAGSGTRITTAMLPGVALPGGATGAPPATNNPPAGVPGAIQARNSEVSNGILAGIIQAGGGTVPA
jgi:regulator of replication initiation timing